MSEIYHPYIVTAVQSTIASKKHKRMGEDKLLPVTVCTLRYLIGAAKGGATVSYKDISQQCGLKNPRLANISFATIGRVMTRVQGSEEFPNFPIPELSVLVTHSGRKTSGEGLRHVLPGIESLSKKDRQVVIDRKRNEAHSWLYWDDLASFLRIAELSSLQPPAEQLFEFDRKSRHASGKSPEHQAMQDRILFDPTSTGIELLGEINRELPNLGGSTCEYEFWSQDRLDVIIKTEKEWVGFEVKPLSSTPEEVRKGIYQTFKYAALMEADLLDRAMRRRFRCILVLAGKMPINLSALANRLRIEVVERYAL